MGVSSLFFPSSFFFFGVFRELPFGTSRGGKWRVLLDPRVLGMPFVEVREDERVGGWVGEWAFVF